MYNRYVPQPDGTFRRNRIQTNQENNADISPVSPILKEPVLQDSRETQTIYNYSAGSFLKHLIPKNLDTGDLLVIVLLLLMAGDCQEEKNSALLTLALYLFL